MVDVATLKELNLDDFKDKQVPIGISNKHVHVSQADLETLFGEGYELTPIKDLSQPGQYAANEKVDVVGPKGEVEIDKGCIVAHLHIHFHTDEAAKMGIKDKQILTVMVHGQKDVVFCDVIARVGDKMKLDFHMDTDEANAALVKNGDVAVILG